MKKMRLLLGVFTAALILAACGTTAPVLDEATERDPDPAGITSLVVSPRTIMEGKIGQQYTFTMTASGVPAGIKVVTFAWTVTGGKPASASVRVDGGEARFAVNHTFGEAGTYAFMASVSKPTHPTDPNQSELLAASRAIVAVETDPVREIDLGSCENWVPAKSGGTGVHVDIWDLKGVPEGALIDMKWDTIGIPDSFIVEYPLEVEVFDTGFVGDARHNGDPLYPGGVVGGPQGSADGVFQKSAANGDEFLVTVLGPHVNTLWSYEIRCRVPTN